MKKRNLKKPIISALEQRILFDGAAVATAVDVLDNSSFSSNASSSSTSNNDATSNSAENSVHEVQAVQGFERDRKEVAFVDVTVKDYQTLVDGVNEGVEVYLVSSLDEIKTTLSSQTNIDAIHILSHGNTGEISVGNDVLNSNTLDDNAQLLETMKNSLSVDGDILLYGCNVASDGTGQEFINSIATLTQADVAASEDTTGNSALGGDWVLEKNSGIIDSEHLNIESYSETLSPTKVTIWTPQLDYPINPNDWSAYYTDQVAPFFYGLKYFYEENGATVDTIPSGHLSSNTLDSTNLLFVMVPTEDFTANDVTYMSNFLNTGGRIVFYGENNGWIPDINNRLSNVITTLGGSFSIDSTDFRDDGTLGASYISSTSPLANGLTQIYYNAASVINYTGAVDVIVSAPTSNGTPAGFIVDQAVGNGRIMLMTDINIMESFLTKYSQASITPYSGNNTEPNQFSSIANHYAAYNAANPDNAYSYIDPTNAWGTANQINYWETTYPNADTEDLFLNLLTNSAANQQIVDGGGNPNAGFGGSPTVTVTASDVTIADDGATTYTVSVRYQGATVSAINESTIGINDITVKNSLGNALTITSATIASGLNTNDVVVNYTVTPPGGSWDNSDSGTYTVGIVNASVSDDAGKQTAGNLTAKTFEVSMVPVADITPPTFDVTPTTSNITATTLDLSASLDEAGKIYYVVVADGATAPSIAQIKAGQDSTGSSALKSGNSDVTTTPFTGTYNITGLSANTAYDIYVVGQDDEGTPNVMASATKVDVTTPHALITFESGNGVLSSDNSISMTYSHTGTSTTFTITAKDTSDQQGHLKYGSLVGDPAGHIDSESIYAIDEGKANSITFSVENGKTFDLISFYLSNQNGNGDETFTITTNKGGSSTGISGADNNIDSDKIILPSTALFQGITSFTITAPSGGAFMEIDDIVLQNIMVVSDTTPPIFDVSPVTSNVTATSLSLNASLDEAGKIYYVVVADGATAPSIAQIKAGQDSTGSAALKSGNSDVSTTPFSGTYNITGLSANTAYDIYVVGQDDEGTPNVMTSATKVDVTMAGLPPVFSSSSSTNFAENTTGTVYDAELSSSTGTVTYTLSGTDSGKFNINSTTGILTFKSAPDYETPTDNGTNNVYNVTIRATDNNGYTDQNVAISVTNANDVNFTTADISNISSESLIKSVTAGSTANITFSAGAFLNVYAPNENAGFPGGLYAYTGIDSEQELIITAQTGYTFDLTSFKFAPDLSQNTTSVKVKFTSGGVSYEDTYSLTVDGTVGYNLIIPSTHPVNDVTEVRIWALAYGEFQDIEITDIKPMGPSVTAATGTYTDTATNDTGFTNTTGTISATASSGSITGYGISTGTTGGNTNVGGTIYDVSKAGTYGTLYVKSSDGSYVYVPTSDSVINATTSTVTDAFTIQATDSNGTGNGTLTITINGVNDTPVLTAPTSASYTDTSATDTFSNTTGTLSASDRDTGATLTYGISTGTTGGSTVIGGVTYDVSKAGTYGTLYVKSSDGSYVYVPSASDINALTSNTIDSFTVSSSEGSLSNTQTFTVNITGVNDTPTAADKTITINEDTPTLLSTSDFGFSDVDTGDTLSSVKITSLESDGALEYYNGTSWVAVTLNQVITAADITGNKLRFNPSSNENGTGYSTFDFTVNDGTVESSAKTITYNVTAVNDTPTVANTITDQNASVSNAFSFVVPLNTFADVDTSDTFTYTAQLVDSNGNLVSGGTLPVWLTFTAGTRTFSGIPAIGDVGTIYVKVTATDNGTGNLNVSDIFTITTNSGPTVSAVTDTYTDTSANDTFANKTGTISATASSGSITGYGISTGTTGGNTNVGGTIYDVSKAGSYGTLYVKSSDGSYVYVPTSDSVINATTSTVTDAFTIQATDGSGTTDNSLTITINGVNDTPSAADKTITINEDTPTLLSTSDFGFSDVDTGDTLSSVKITSLESDGALEYYNGTSWVAVTLNQVITAADITGNKLRFNPSSNENGTGYSTFDFTVNDGTVESSAKTITYNVTAVNDTPSTEDKTITINEDTPTLLSTSDFGFSDVDTGDTLSSVKITSLESDGALEYYNGTSWVAVTLNQVITAADITGNKLRFNPSSNENGASYSTFDFTVNDGTVESSAKTITYNVTAVNDAPSGTVSINGTPTQGETLIATNNISDEDGLGTISYQWYADGVLINGATNSTYTLTQNEVNKNITVVASYTDGQNTVETLTSNATTSVVNVNDAPVGTVSISGTPTQGETLTATNNITDADGMGTISYQWYADGVLISGATNSTYTLTQNEVNKNITVVASYTDGFGANETVTSSATIDVVNVNDAPTVSSNNIDVELGFGDSYTKDISVLFNDIDSDNVFTYEAVNLPLGLSIDPITGVISGSANSSGEFIITIKATDNGTPPLSISRTYKMIVVAPAQVEVPQPSPSETPTNNTPTVIVPPIVVTTFADTLSLGTINNNLGNEVADNVGTGYLNNNGLNPQETTNPRNNNSDNQAQTASTNRNNNGNYIEADANLNVNANGQVTFDRATQDSFSTVGIAIEDMTIENNRLEIKVVDTSVAQNFVVTKTDGTSLPTGLSFDPRTGSISGTVPENLDKLDITIKATNPDGTTRVLNIKIDLKKLKEANRADGEKYIGLKDQLAVESQKLEGYGNYLVSLFA